MRADACLSGSVILTLWLGEPVPVSAVQSRASAVQSDRQLKSVAQSSFAVYHLQFKIPPLKLLQ